MVCEADMLAERAVSVQMRAFNGFALLSGGTLTGSEGTAREN
jgi:hypothetical protein